MEESVSLFLDLEPGRKADLEVVARAAMAYSAAIKELAYVLDPSLEIRVELASGTEGSLSLNSIIRSISARVNRQTLKAIAFVILGWFANDLRGYGVSEIVDTILQRERVAELSQADIERIAESVSRTLQGQVAKDQVEAVFQELERDEAIRGVGATSAPGTRPDNIIPRNRFRERGGIMDFIEETPERRTRRSRERVVLVSPVLLPTQRRWRFSFHEGEFGAPIRDQDFLDAVLSGRTSIPMSRGIEMDVLLETREEFHGGVWIIKERTVLRVFNVSPGLLQGTLQFRPPPSDQSDDNDG